MVLADDGRQAAEAAGLVRHDDVKASDPLVEPLIHVPRQVHPAFRRRLKALQGVAIDGMHGDPFPRGHNPDDAIAGKRMARSEEHTSELQSLMRISYAVFC